MQDGQLLIQFEAETNGLDKAIKKSRETVEKETQKMQKSSDDLAKARENNDLKAQETAEKSIKKSRETIEKENKKIETSSKRLAEIQIKQAQETEKKVTEAYKNIGESAKNNLNNATTGIIAGATGITAGLGALVKGTEEFRTEMGMLETNTEKAGANLTQTKQIMKDLTVITGETDSALEGVSNLLASGLQGDKLADAVDDLKGAVISFPDTLKFEGLSDSLQEIINSGELTGTFTELLGRMGTELKASGLSLQSYEEEIKNAETANERLNISLKYLNATGLSETTALWEQNNAQIIESKESQYELNEELSKLATEIEPILTQFVGLLIDLTSIIIDNKNEVIAWSGAIVGGAVALKTYFIISELISKLKAMQIATNSATLSQTALNVVLNANPIGVVITLIGALTGALVLLDITTVSATEKVDDLSKSYTENKKAIDDNYNSTVAQTKIAGNLKNQIFELDEQIKSGTLSIEEQNIKYNEMEALSKQLADIIPEVSQALWDETGQLNIQRNEVDKLTTSFINLSIAQAQSEAYGEKIKLAVEKEIEAKETLIKLQEEYNKEQAKPLPSQALEWLGLETIDFSAGLNPNVQSIARLQEYRTNIEKTSDLIKQAQADTVKYAQAQSEALKSIDKQTAENKKETSEIEIGIDKKRIDTAKEQSKQTIDIKKEQFDEEKRLFEQKTELEGLTLEQQKAFWEQKDKEYSNHAEIQKEIDNKLFEAQKNLNAQRVENEQAVLQKQQEAIDKANALQEEYISKLKSRTEEIFNQTALFSGVTIQDETSSQELTQNLQDQITQLKEYQEVISELSQKGLSEGLMEKLSSFGVGNLAQLKALNESTDESLAEYDKLFQEKYELARLQAEKELTPLRENTVSAIKQMTDEVGVQLEIAPELARSFVSDLSQGIDENSHLAVNSASQMADDIIAEVERALESLNSLNNIGLRALSNTTRGLTRGYAMPSNTSFQKAINTTNIYNNTSGGNSGMSGTLSIEGDKLVAYITSKQNKETERKGDEL